ncbi:phage tail protein [Paramagnetospirillum kuznetsovii]|uniref:Phage tail protein n=1 Tax=Paramagnetospirillum kuznetsovii TaxID=2053833 RepID=A0A364NVJ9_9PROT|nr:portal protein [Paramagnetospirillum kuznetsovii]RAU21086.1 phage tail protein [Paramagnetospirillum kuznetsovii]
MIAPCIDMRIYFDKRLVALRSERTSWLTHWMDLSKFITPRRGRFLATQNQGNRGASKTSNIIDSTATHAAQALAAGMQSGITSPTRPWFHLTIENEDSESGPVHLWLDECHRRMLAVLSDSNAYNALHTAYEELGVFGTACIVVEEDDDDVIRVQTLTVGEYMLGNNKKGVADSLYREFTMTVGQVVERFGYDNCSVAVKSLYDHQGQDREVIIGAAVEPNTGRFKHPLLNKKAFLSAYWEMGQRTDEFLELKGYDELPFMAFRWRTLSNEPYGESPGMACLGDVKALQKMQLKSAQAIDKHVDPPMVASVDMKNEAASLLPGGITYVPNQSQVGFKPAIEIQPNIQGIEAKIAECQKRIKTMFYEDLWLMLQNMEGVQPRNQMEIAERKQEKMLMLGPVLERLQYELLDPLVDRVFAIMQRAELLPVPPPELTSGKIDVEYVSTLSEAQKAVDTGSVERMVAFIGNLAGARPDALDNLNVDETIALYGDMISAPPKLLMDADQVAAMRQQRAQQAQQQQMMQQSMAATQGAKNLADTDVGGGMNALQKMMGG